MRFVQFSFLAEAENGGLDGGEGGGEVLGGDEIADDGGPEAGEGFVVAAVFGVLPAGGDVVGRNAQAHALQRFFRAKLSRIKGANGDVGGVSPVGFGQSMVFPAAHKVTQN